MQLVKLKLTKEEEKFFDNSANSRFLSVDPLADSYPFLTPYQFASNNPIACVDLDGTEGLISILFPNPYSEENTAKLKNNLGIKKGSFADKAIDFLAGAGNRAMELNNPVTYLKAGGEHLKNMYNNGKAIVTSPTAGGKADAAVHLALPSLNSTENMGMQAVTAVKNGDAKTLGAMTIDAISNIIAIKGFGSPFKTSTIAEDAFENMYRVQGGGSKIRFVIKDNDIAIAGDDMLFVNMGQEGRALEFLAKRGDDAVLVKFKINKSFAEKIRQEAVPQNVGRQNPGNPQIVDATKASGQYGIPKNYFEELLKNIDPSSVEITTKKK